MGRPPKNRNAEPVVPAKPPMMKYAQAMRLADKNARTIMKMSQLMEIVLMPGHSKSDPHDRVGAQIGVLKARLNRRLAKLAKWADSSADERHAEFRNNPAMSYPYRTLTKPMLYSKPIPVNQISAMKGVQVPDFYKKGSKSAGSLGSPAQGEAKGSSAGSAGGGEGITK